MSDLSPAQESALKFLEATEADQLAFTKALIRTPSPNPPGDERAVASLVTDKLAELGVTDVRTVSSEDTRPNLIVRIPGSKPGRNLMLSGHLDTKPAGDMAAWKTDPWEAVEQGDQLIGLGSGDMKAAVAAMVYAGAAVANAGGFGGELQLVFTADEEAGSIKGSKWMAENGHLAADVAVIGEPSGVDQEWQSIAVISRGAALFKIKVTGTQMHSSISDRIKGVNATVEMARLIDRMDREFKDWITYEPHSLSPMGPTVNVGVMASAGIFYGVYPGNAEFACDIRTLPGMTREQLEADLNRFLAEAMKDAPDLRAELVFEIFVPATEISPEEPAVQALQWAAEQVLGFSPPLDAFPGATDAPHFQLIAGVPTVAAFGPGLLPRAHSPNEQMAIDGVWKAARIYALAALCYLEN
ncbi:MAG TPA: M20 family metallopeptidase [Acidimicrobiia bacterium]|nr:M20 family metallopeptidase [Acidimicrobiia bacterium]